MCRNISTMLLVLFAVLLILPESQGKGSGIFLWECYLAVKNVGDIFCTLYGYGETCTRRLKNQLQKWGNGMMERKKILCRL
uniref:Putative secreted salivary protein n=1 Tax=Ixodes ricinus TaxID=34613 RepID=A0A090XB87_IXORI